MHSRNMESPPRRRNGGGGGAGSSYRRYSRSRSRSRDRSRERNFRRRNSRSRSRDRYHYRRGGGGGGSGSVEKDLYRDLINDDYKEERNHNSSRYNYDARSNNRGRDDMHDEEQRDRQWKGGRDYERDQRDYDRDTRSGDRKDHRQRNQSGSAAVSGSGSGGGSSNNRRYNSADRDSNDSEDGYGVYHKQSPSNTIIVLGLQAHITEADIMSALIQVNMAPTSIRLIRKPNTGASRGFAFVEFNTVDEAAFWMDLTQGSLQLPDQTRASLQYSHTAEPPSKMKQNATDWYCVKCGVFNFKRRFSCFKCYASRVESGKGGEGNDEISNILTKKIMLRNLDALTNEEGVLTVMQQLLPDLAKKINKILISRDLLTQTSRGICYLNFENLVDSMNLHNSLTTLEPPLRIDNRDIVINYCIDHENRHIVSKDGVARNNVNAAAVVGGALGSSAGSSCIGPLTAAELAASNVNTSTTPADTGSVTVDGQYTLADVPRLAEYSAQLYASTPAEQAHFLQYYTDYYTNEISKGQFSNLPTDSTLMTEANSGAAVALSAIQRKQKKMNRIETTATAAATAAAQAAAAVKAAFAAQNIVTPKGNDGKTYPTPDVTLYQYDETSGYYYDPKTGLYYDAHTQYYYNKETGAYLYWDSRRNTYTLATAAAAAASVIDTVPQDNETKLNDDEQRKDKKESGNKHDKVKVAKKIVKDMEKWAKQLNQKKDYTTVAVPQPILPAKSDSLDSGGLNSRSSGSHSQANTGGPPVYSGYADLGFSILEKKERVNKLNDYISNATTVASSSTANVNTYASDSDEEHAAGSAAATPAVAVNRTAVASASEDDYVDFQKLTCLLCKRAFQSLEILHKHLKMSALHKENLQKHNNMTKAASNTNNVMSEAEKAAALSYRDRAKERRLKYGECDPPPPNRSRERFEHEIKSLQSRKSETAAPAMPIGSNNVGNRLLQKMGWTEGQGLGRKNQGRTQIIEAESRSSTAGLGTKGGIGPGDDYKTYIKKMMKSRYESV